MATSYTYGNDHIIVEPILSSVCWKEYDLQRRAFTYNNLDRTIRQLKSRVMPGHRHDYADAVTSVLEYLRIPKSEWVVIRALTSKYFKQVKDAKVYHPLADKHWIVTVQERSREVLLYNHVTMTRSESNFTKSGFHLGSVTVKEEICRNKGHIELHRQKCAEVTYRILSGK